VCVCGVAAVAARQHVRKQLRQQLLGGAERVVLPHVAKTVVHWINLRRLNLVVILNLDTNMIVFSAGGSFMLITDLWRVWVDR
jgi:hypothetical protein